MYARLFRFNYFLPRITAVSPVFSNLVDCQFGSIYSYNVHYVIRYYRSENSNHPVIGTDLGTTNSRDAVLKGKPAKVIENTDGSKSTPSVVTSSTVIRSLNDPQICRPKSPMTEYQSGLSQEKVVPNQVHGELELGQTNDILKLVSIAEDYIEAVEKLRVKIKTRTEENKQLVKLKIKMEYDLDRRRKPLIHLKIRSRIAQLEKKFLTELLLDAPRYEKWNLILTSSDPHFTENDEVLRFRKSVQVATDIFIDAIHIMYGDFSDIGAEKIDFNLDCTEEDIMELFEDLGVPYNQERVNAIYTLLQPIEVPVSNDEE